MTLLKDTIWQRWFSKADHQNDQNKDASGKGTMQRYNEMLAKDLDNNILALISGQIQNTIQPNTMQADFIPYREEHLGNSAQPFLLSADEAMRRRALRHWHRLVSERGTKKGMVKLFSWIGLTAVITEYFDTAGFDSATTWDSDTRPTLDSGRCSPCSAYSIDLTGAAVLDNSLWFGILSVIAFHEPINADLLSLSYNAFTLYPLGALTGTYDTQTQGLHSPELNGGGTTIWQFDPSLGLSGLGFGYTPTFLYPDGVVKTVYYEVDAPASVLIVDFGGQALVGTFDATAFTGAKIFDFSDNTDLTSLGLPSSTVGIDAMNLRNCGLVLMDFTSFTRLGGDIDLSENPQVTVLTFNPAKSVYPCTSFNASVISKSGVLDLEPLLFDTDSTIRIIAAPNLVEVWTATTVNNNTIADIDVSYCPMLDKLKVDSLRGHIKRISVEGNAVLNALNVGAAFVRPNATAVYANGTVSLSGIQNWLSLPISHLEMQGSGISSITHATDSAAIDMYDLRNCINLGYYSLLPLEGLLMGDDSEVHLENCTLSSTQVKDFIIDIRDILVTVRGEVAPGTYTGRKVYIDGTNGALIDLAGIAAAATLVSLGVAVYYN